MTKEGTLASTTAAAVRFILWLVFIGLVCALTLFSRAHVSKPVKALSGGTHNFVIHGSSLAFFASHELVLRLDADALQDFDATLKSRLGHTRVDSPEPVYLPVYFRDVAILRLTGPRDKTVQVSQLELRRRVLPGTWLMLGLLVGVVILAEWFLRKPITKERLTTALLIASSSAVAIIIGAVALQVFETSRKPSEEWRVFPPNLKEAFYVYPDITPGLPEGIVTFTTNSEGVRAKERDSHFPEMLSVLCLGASTTECLYLGDENHWPRVLEKRLESKKGPKVWVGNAGHSGFSTARLVTVASNYVPRIKPKYVIALTGFNEGIVPDEETKEWVRLSEPDSGIKGTVKATLRKIALLRLVKHALFNHERHSPNDFDMSTSTAWYETARERYREHAKRIPPRERTWDDLDLSPFEDALVRLDQVCRRYDATLILCTQPAIYRSDLTPQEERLTWMMGNYTPATKRRRMDVVNQRLRQVAAKLNVRVVDLDEKMPRTTEVFYDDCHFNIAGAKMVADTISAEIFETSVESRAEGL